MISKRTLSDIRALHLDKNRKEQQLFIAEGEKVVAELLLSDLKVDLVAGTEKYDNAASTKDYQYYTLSESELLKISLLRTPNKVLAVAHIPVPRNIDYSNDPGILLALDGINDPGNLGTLIRTADWFGIRNIICSPTCVDAYNPKVVQSAMGSLFRMNIQYGNLEQHIAAAKAGHFRVFGACADGEPYGLITPPGKTMLVVGSESHGISDAVMNLVDTRIGIPKVAGSKAESLNAGVAGAILLSHFGMVRK